MMATKIATDLATGDILVDGARVLGPALAANVPLGEPNNPNDKPFDHATDVAYPIGYIDGGDGVRVFDRDATVTVR
jgi:hypothetical protein